jgi:hypothetical protein
MSPDLTVNAERSLLSGDTALVSGNWTLKARDAEGNPGPMSRPELLRLRDAVGSVDRPATSAGPPALNVRTLMARTN